MAAPSPHLRADTGVGHHRPVSYIQPLWETEGVDTRRKGKDCLSSSYCARHCDPCSIHEIVFRVFTHVMLDYPHMLGAKIKDQLCV